MRIRDFFRGRMQRPVPKSVDPSPAAFEVLEPRLLLNAAYEVWGGNTDYSEGLGGWWNAALNIDKLDYTKLGEANGTATFDGTYAYYVIATRAQVQVDTVQGSDGSYVTYLSNTGNTFDAENIGGSPDGYYGVVGTQYDWRNTFAGYLLVQNPWSWAYYLALGEGEQTGITVIAGADLKPAVHVWIADSYTEQLPGGGPGQYEFDFDVNEPGLVDSARFQAPTGLWYDLERNSWGLESDYPTFDTMAALQAAFPDGTYTLEMTSSVLGTFTTDFGFFGMQPTQVPVVTTPAFAQSDVPTDLTVQWDPCTDPYVTNIVVDIDDNVGDEAYHDWELSPSATSSGPASLTAAQNYEVDVRFQNMYSGQNEDGYSYATVKETERERVIRTAGGGPVLPDLYVDTGIYTPGAYSPGDTFQLSVSGGNNGPGNAFAFDYLGAPIPFYAQVRLSRDLVWGNGDDVVLWELALGSIIGGPESGGGEDITVTLPTEIATGHYHVVGKIDSTDLVIESDKTNNILWSPAADVYIPGPESFVLTAPAAVTVTAGDVVTVQWTAGNVPAGSTVSLCYDEDTVWWNENEHWFVVDTPVSEGAGSYLWNTAGVAPGTYYLAGYMYDWYGVFTISQMTAPEYVNVVSAQSLALTAPSGVSAVPGDVIPIQWVAGGVIPGTTVSLCYDEDGIWWNENEHWLVVDMPVSGAVAGKYLRGATGAGGGTYLWDTAGVTPGTYWVAGYLYDWHGTFTFSHMTAGQEITFQPPFVVTGPSDVTIASGDQVSIAWNAYDVVPGSTVSLCYDEDTTWWNYNEHWVVVDYGPISDGAGSYLWNTAGVAPGTYYLAGYMYDWHGTFTISQMTEPVTVKRRFEILAPPLPATAAPGDVVPIQWTTCNVVPGSTVSLCYDEDTIWWNENEHWFVVDQGPVSEGAGSYAWNTAGVPQGTYYVAGYLYDWKGNFTIFQMTEPITFPFSISDVMPLTEGHHLTYSGQRDGVPVSEERYVLAPQVIDSVTYQRLTWTRSYGGTSKVEMEYLTADGLGYSLNARLGGEASGDYAVVFSDPLERAPDSPVVSHTYSDVGNFSGQWLSGLSTGFVWYGQVVRSTTVLGFEWITAPAGSFRCVKTYVTETQTEWWTGGWRTETSASTMWIANGIGLVNQTSVYVGSDSSGGSWLSSRSRQLTAYS